MASKIFCDPCSSDHNSAVAVRYCCQCEENMCKECAESHVKYKAFKTHQLNDITSADFHFKLGQNYCSTHENVVLDFYCTKHDALCCRKCIPEFHKACENVLPVEDASKYVTRSSLLVDTMQEITEIIRTLQLLSTNRGHNLKNLKQAQQSILDQIENTKTRILKIVNDLAEKLRKEVSVTYDKNRANLEKEMKDIEQMEAKVVKCKQELDFLKDRGSKNQLFIALHQHAGKIKKTGKQIQEITTTYKEIDIKFDELTSQIGSIGTISETRLPCSVQYKPTKLHQAQVQPDIRRSLTEFKMEGKLNLKLDEVKGLSDLVVTADNRLFCCNYSFTNRNIYTYKNCKWYDNTINLSSRPFGITLLPGTDEAVVTLPDVNSIQFINTTTMTTGNQVNVEFNCFGVTSVDDKIIVGGYNVVHILNTNGTQQTKIKLDGLLNIVYLHFNRSSNQILCRGVGKMKCVDLHGKLIYEYEVSGQSGMAVDRDGNVYLGGFHIHDIQRLSKDGQFRDIVLTKNDGINYPRGMTFNNDYTKLFVINCNRDEVNIYSCK